jgi:class III poly(R)-hydroxyalkanoic acid synthase PhaE subunit
MNQAMPEQGTEFLERYQSFMREGWETWSRQLQDGPASAQGASGAAVDRMLDGLKGYGEWLSRAAQAPAEGAPMPWPAMPPGLGGMPPFGAAATQAPEAFAKQFEDWLATTREMLGMPAFGIGREQQEEQQALMRAAIEYAEQQSRYQALLGRVHADGIAALERHRAAQGSVDPESLRALYDLWVGLTEEAYAKAAMSDQFREVYAALGNAQMRLRVLQQRQVERLAVQLGIPSRSEVNSLGERMQAMRREVRALAAEVAALRKPSPQKAVKTSKKAVLKKPVARKTRS